MMAIERLIEENRRQNGDAKALKAKMKALATAREAGDFQTEEVALCEIGRIIRVLNKKYPDKDFSTMKSVNQIIRETNEDLKILQSPVDTVAAKKKQKPLIEVELEAAKENKPAPVAKSRPKTVRRQPVMASRNG